MPDRISRADRLSAAGEAAIRHSSYPWVSTGGSGMDLARMIQAVNALQDARDGAGFVLRDPGVVHGLRRVLAADEISFTDRDLRTGASGMAPPPAIGADTWAGTNVFRGTPASCGIECCRASPSAGWGTGLV